MARLLAAILVAIATGFPVHGQPREPPETPAAPGAEARRWLADLAVWTTPYFDLVQRRGEQIMGFLEAAERLMLSNADLPERERSARTDAARLLSGFREVDQAFLALPPAPTASSLEPATVEQSVLQLQLQVRPSVEAFLQETTILGETFSAKLIEAASFEVADLKALEDGLYDLTRATLLAENLRLGNAQGGRDDGAYYLVEAIKDSNLGLLSWFDAERASYAGASADEVNQRVDEINIHVRASKAAVAALRDRNQRFRAKALAGRRTTPPVEPRLVNVSLWLADSMDESAAVEDEVADTLAAMAALVAAGDVEESRALAADIDGLIERRQEIDRQRRAEFAEGQ